MTQPTETELNFDNLPRYQKRRFVPDQANLGQANETVALYQKLLDRPIGNPAELEAWLLDWSELDAAVSQEGAVRYIRMTCQTDDPARAQAYKEFVETVAPAAKVISDKLARKYLAQRERWEGGPRYAVHDRGLRADVELFRDANVPLQTQEALLSQEYQTICGAMAVQFDGQERTLAQMSKYLLEVDRSVRQSAWRLVAQRRLQEKDRLEELFDKMFALRRQIAANADCADYREYQFRAFHRFDYTPEDCLRYHDAVAQRVVPLWRKILLHRREQMKLDALKPWDTSVDPQGRPPLKPFEQASQLMERGQEVFRLTDPTLGEQFAQMRQMGLLDLANRKGKAPGGYQSTLSEARRPFIFMNAVGVDQDVRTLLHEGGHAFHALAAIDEPLLAYRSAPMEFCEVASMSMELLAGEHLSAFYNEEDLLRSRRRHLEDIIFILPWIATVDAFQHWIYTHPDQTPRQRRQAWEEIYQRFSGEVIDWTGLEEERAYMWHRQLHIFEYPFYYIEYGIAQLGALQVWVRAKKDPRQALADYRNALTLGGSQPLPALFQAAGLAFDFSQRTISPLVDAVEAELERL